MTARVRVDEPQTLQEAHDELRRTRPRAEVSSNEWLAFHRQAERLYQRIAKVDRDHHHEALYFAGAAKASADLLAEQMAPAESG